MKNNMPKKLKTKIIHLFQKHAGTSRWKENGQKLIGILDMVGGLEYHYRNYRRIEKRSRKDAPRVRIEDKDFPIIPDSITHEMVAYLNRLGQIEALFTSDWFKQYVDEKDLALILPTIFALLPFRNKFTAHRSIDAPRNETFSQMINHANLPFERCWYGPSVDYNLEPCFDFNECNILHTIKIANTKKTSRHKLLFDHNPNLVHGIEVLTTRKIEPIVDEISINFILLKDHARICDEIEACIKAFFQ